MSGYVKAAGAGVAVIGTGVSIYGSIKSARAQLDADRATAELMRVQADQTIVRGRQEANAIVSDYLTKLDDRISEFASRNINVNGDVAKIIQNQTIEASMIDADQLKKNALAEAESLRAQASNLIDSAESQYHGAIINGTGQAVAGVGSALAAMG